MSTADFQIEIPVRISDINYGGHLGHTELIKITHHARVKFFADNSLQEQDLNGAGIIVKSIQATYKAESFFDELLHISIYLQKIDKASCEFRYEISKKDNQEVATVLETVLFMNYATRRIVRVPRVIHELKNNLNRTI